MIRDTEDRIRPTSENPYESPAIEGDVEAIAPLRRPAFGTFLIALWIVEGGFKAGLLATAFLSGFNPLAGLAVEFRSWNRLTFLLVALFMIVETIGPWIGIYYLTGRRARTIPFERALGRTLGVAGLAALVLTLGLMLGLELAAQVR